MNMPPCELGWRVAAVLCWERSEQSPMMAIGEWQAGEAGLTGISGGVIGVAAVRGRTDGVRSAYYRDGMTVR